jgi:hypothetical protein
MCELCYRNSGRCARESKPRALSISSWPPSTVEALLQSPNLTAARAFAFAASCSRFLGGAVVSSECNRRADAADTSSTAAINAASFIFAGLVNPLIFLTNCSDAARISSSVTGGSKLKSVLMFRHIGLKNILTSTSHMRSASSYAAVRAS